MRFSERLQNLMKEKDVKWKTVSEELKIGINQKRYWETHDNIPDGETLKKLADYFQVSIQYLIGQTDDRGQKNPPIPFEGTGDEMERYFALLNSENRAYVKSVIAERLKEQLQGP